ncbi:acyl-CoA synthetase (AMP-forming)/AMP-acid ligase II [Chitinophaga dinghuensis]|uniref:Acyl-CoA synthetase (AMP-forming)/AMP-acid ligase II n=1 Tax=Chitinophaga dinghuensis TaxID=1539050 RepID=A0A327VUB3_9BACT|nr:AMP-binding protein [Chitinophaga dinghuensis]RAJ77619.1 acyl-CoA synthetase (AMP-forming)/AMP-acid ligase II [Chitinophaga dinghuensis]
MIIGFLFKHAVSFPDRIAFTLLEDGESRVRRISYSELYKHVQRLGEHLKQQRAGNTVALLLYQDVIDFTIAFLACQYAGIIAVPIYFARGTKHVSRMHTLVEDAAITMILTSDNLATYVQQHFASANSAISVLVTDHGKFPDVMQRHAPAEDQEIAFLQYTSGSTGKPKGVMVTASSLVHNQEVIRHAFGCDESAVIFSWLPFHHDMGLIGSLLHTIYIGCSCVLMPPAHFIQRPFRWLSAISSYKVTHSGGPNFGYDLCVSRITPEELSTLDLSSWKVAYNGAEPVRYDTIRAFSNYFRTAGFREEAFHPCYGLAEATLMVTGVRSAPLPLLMHISKDSATADYMQPMPANSPDIITLVSSGTVTSDMDVKIISPVSEQVCGEREVGEVCICGDSVTDGYWRKDNTTLFYMLEDRRYLRTGDLGFLSANELFVHGRLKEMLIIRGENFYPYDIEYCVSQCHDAIEPNGVAAFSVLQPQESFVIIAEIKRKAIQQTDLEQVLIAISKNIAGTFGITPHEIILTSPLGIPRTTSGKLQRGKCATHYQEQTFNVLASSISHASTSATVPAAVAALPENPDTNAIRQYVLSIISSRTGIPHHTFSSEDIELTELGLDSLRSMEVINTINKDLQINLEASVLLRNSTMSALTESIESLLWLKSAHATGNEIII